jgi:hypothetical protein
MAHWLIMVDALVFGLLAMALADRLLPKPQTNS